MNQRLHALNIPMSFALALMAGAAVWIGNSAGGQENTAPACFNTPNWPTGRPWIRGTLVLPFDLPAPDQTTDEY